MQTNHITPKQSLNPAFLKQKPERKEIELFKKEFISLLDRINENESEEHHKNMLIDFLNSVYYKNKYYINTKDRTDLVIHNGKEANTSVGVLVEVKKPTNKTEMVSMDNLNAKSFHELVLYYLRERKKGGNFELRHLVITNFYQWFVFDAQIFEKLFYENKNLLQKFEQFEQKKLSGTSTDFFYKEIASPEIDKIKNEISYTYFDIRDYDKILRNEDKSDDKKLIALYKFLSPTHLLKLSFANDYNQLNKEFYSELLYIIGLEEIKEGTQKFIVRKKEGSRHSGSIIENAIEVIDSMDMLADVNNAKQYGSTKDEKLFNVALDLSITWINRILFLKLLEAQIIKYHKGNQEYAFLSTKKLDSFDELNSLFFQILARKESDRKGELKKQFSHVPYLNSSLFERTNLEAETIVISNLRDNTKLDLYTKSILKTQKENLSKDKLRPLEYLLRFLDAYDFSSEGSEDIQEENKALISASVLGLIFEKINGYKDGSFFTPSFITMYMSNDAITRTIIQKFNDVKGWNCQTITDLYNHINIQDLSEANQIFNSIRLCDMAVGSGHYLVSALNEMIALKSRLGILIDKDGKRLRDYKVTVENDELIITDNQFGIFQYSPDNHESQRVQETLFHEKQTIIENCLFGVDINSNSVKICQLRLWIELLKHTYYRIGTNELETLPNIDINIKCGNSLVNRFALDEDLKPALKSVGYSISDYKTAISSYHNAHNKEEKRKFEKLISDIKSGLRTEIGRNDKNSKGLQKWEKELINLTTPSLFEPNQKEKKVLQKKIKEAEKEVAKYRAIIDEIKSNRIYENALEWRFEFPQVLNEDGDFVGFDTIIGNPPYIQLQTMGEVADVYKQMNYNVYERTGDIYCLFYELGNDILRPNYFLSFITSNKWMRAGYGEKMRKYFVGHTNPVLLIDFAGIKVFDEATVDVNIMTLQKACNEHKTTTCLIKKDFNSGITKLSDYLSQFAQISAFGEKATTSFAILSGIEQRIKEKIEKAGIPLKDWDIQINYGIKTGFNEAFIISGEKRKELIEKSPKSADIIRPILRGRDIKRYGYEFADLWLINVHNGTPTTPPINIEEYPAVKEYLDQFYTQLTNRQDKGCTPYNLRSCIYTDDFSKQKIVYPGLMRITKNNPKEFPRFYFDENGDFTLTNDSYFIIGKDTDYLSIVLNSKLTRFSLPQYIYSFDDTGFKVFTDFFDKMPITNCSEEVKKSLTNTYKQLIKKKEQNLAFDNEENQLNGMIYKLYGLTEEEINFIEIL